MSHPLRIILILTAGLACVPALAQVAISTDVRDALAMGHARVIIELRLANEFTLEGELSETERQAQRAAIAEGQAEVLMALAAGDTRLIRRPETLPFLALEIGPDDLQKLADLSSRVSRIRLDGVASPNRREKLQGALQ